jgi:hypothetical protein
MKFQLYIRSKRNIKSTNCYCCCVTRWRLQTARNCDGSIHSVTRQRLLDRSSSNKSLQWQTYAVRVYAHTAFFLWRYVLSSFVSRKRKRHDAADFLLNYSIPVATTTRQSKTKKKWWIIWTNGRMDGRGNHAIIRQTSWIAVCAWLDRPQLTWFSHTTTATKQTSSLLLLLLFILGRMHKEEDQFYSRMINSVQLFCSFFYCAVRHRIVVSNDTPALRQQHYTFHPQRLVEHIFWYCVRAWVCVCDGWNRDLAHNV